MSTKRIKKSFVAKTVKPCDVEYRLRRANESVEKTLMFVDSIGPEAFPPNYHTAIMVAINNLFAALSVAESKAPKKKSRTKHPARVQEAAE